MEVKLDVFEGPLELLYVQLKKNKLSIYDIDIAVITAQYLNEIQRLSLDVISEFVLMAAELISIKSKMLLWTPKEPDPREELVNRLEIYEFFREMALGLKATENSGKGYRKSQLKTREALVINHDLEKLMAVYQGLIRQMKAEVPPTPTIPIEREVYSIEEKVEELKATFAVVRHMSFKALLEKIQYRAEVIALFMALLELIKDCYIITKQTDNFSDIYISRVEG